MAKSRRSGAARSRTAAPPQQELVELTTRLEDVSRDIATQADAFVEDVTVKRAGSKLLVRITVDLPEDRVGAMSLDHVADVSRALAEKFDETDVIPGAYTLEVSTPGTSRPLTQLRHFLRARTRLVQLTTVTGDTVTGRLHEVIGSQLHVINEESNTPLVLEFADVKHGNVQVELKRAASDDEIEVED
ncbi:ribosome maturation factor RimP [Micrococcales bacterium KH10]|nr:ribosome maturation factor RimP [Micrococcales bacterium KH10]